MVVASISLACCNFPLTSATIASAALPGTGAITAMATSPPGTFRKSSKERPSLSWMFDQRLSNWRRMSLVNGFIAGSAIK